MLILSKLNAKSIIYQGGIHFKSTVSVWKEVIKEGIFLGEGKKLKYLNEKRHLVYEEVIPNRR